MLKRVNVSDVELGMFVHKLEGNWFRHPFWKSKFLLEDPAMLEDLHASAVSSVIIDVSRGFDVRQAPRRLDPPPARASRPDGMRGRASRQARAGEPAPVDPRSTAPQTLAREFGVANRIAGKSRKVISRVFLESRFGKTIRASEVAPVIEDVFASIQRNPHAFNGLMRCKRDNEYLYRHALAVSALMVSLARRMKLSPAEIRDAGMAGLLIDVGIGHLPVDLSASGGDYRDVAPEILTKHVLLGGHFLESAGGFAPAVLEACLGHHERLDGSGYPAGLRGAQIGMFARMAAICDAYDTLVSDATGRSGMDPAIVLRAMSDQRDWFDHALVLAFIEAMGIYPIGSVVRLRSGRLALVVDQAQADGSLPRVRAFHSLEQQRMINPVDIDLSTCFGEDAIVGTADPAVHGIADFAALRERLFMAAARGG